ncbi:hypothetical protein [Candidatus Uabimicrobium amorphum]|uniref:Alpha-2-macroglobulin domain-containing protein n=1 Tax=Uabimicrobium amorphum TaxID=2596890 RepID=A0A5S9IR11_UABAM|nr:hypothetical protein [Candidatus Uabimicrobium amorphum]BBM86518.1 hypothetical protein UABAM_04904 [Candidatus Uabimicrobium amorphum]
MKHLCLLLVLIGSMAILANEIGFDEQFNLVENREEVLKKLIPGTPEYYYYHCLHYQHQKNYDKVHSTLKQWIKRHGRTSRSAEIENRQALFEYTKNPQTSIAHIVDKLGLSFSHQRREQQKAKQYSSKLDNKLISYEKLFADALRTSGLYRFEAAILERLLDENLSADRRRSLLQKITRPDHPRLPMLVVEDLKYRYSGGFGSLSIHNKLLRSQLDDCARRMPKLMQNSNFIHAYLRKLSPSNDINWQDSLEQKSNYVNKLWHFVKKLSAAQNSLKAHVLYHKLLLQLKQGKYNKKLFVDYLKLPRNAVYSNRDFVYYARHKVNLRQNYKQHTHLDAVGDDTKLVREYLQHFLRDAKDYSAFEKYIDSNYLKELFAETKIVYGIGNAIDWYSMLPTQKYKDLQERVDLDFVPTNKDVFAKGDAVALQIAIKNVQNLIVKTYYINTKNYYKKHGSEITTAIDLDGLVANHEKRFSYKQVPLRRHVEKFDFAHIKDKGVYIIEFIGNGQSNRALIRKGNLLATQRISSAGHVFSIYDESNSLVKDARILYGNREYTANEDGEITVPFSNRPGSRNIVLYHNGFAQLHSFYHQREDYKFVAGIYVNRESIIHKNKCRIVVRPHLYVNGEKISVDLLKDVELSVKTVNRDGISSSIKVADFALHDDKESKYEFKVPEKLASVNVTLNAKIDNLSQAKKQSLSARQSLSINGIDRTATTESLFLRKVDSGYQLEFLGKTGEPRPDRVLQVTCKHHYFTNNVTTTLQTDKHGRLYLGELKDIDRVSVTGGYSWSLEKDRHSYPQVIHGTTDKVLRIPIMHSGSVKNLCSLLEVRNKDFVHNVSNKVSVGKNYLKIKGLRAGDYSLLLKKEGVSIAIRVTEGKLHNDYAVGNERYLQVSKQKVLQVAPLKKDQGKISVKLMNFTKATRVHVIATHFLPQENIYHSFGELDSLSPSVIKKNSPNSLYLSGRNIGEEYRYILERKYAKKFPGNMLARPSLLLNPWSLRKTDTGVQHAKSGDSWDASADMGSGAYAPRRSLSRKPGSVTAQLANYNFNFLANGSLILTNLKPDENGEIEIKVSAVMPRQHIHVVAMDNDSVVYRQLALPRGGKQYKDLRLIYALNAKKHFTQQKNISAVRSGRLFNIANITTSEIEVYDSLQNVHSFFTTMTNNATLKEFQFILNWPQLSAQQKSKSYSKYACHELNFFVYKKDPAFFTKVVKPYLQNKKDKTFLDDWLIGSDLRKYLRPWEYGRLNVVERILLGQILKKEAPQIARQIKDLCDLQPINLDRFNRVFTTAIANTSLSTSDKLGLESAKKQVPREPSPVADMEEAFAEDADEMDGFFGRNEESKLRSSRMEKLRKKRARRDRAAREKTRQFYRKEDKTREWVENNYYHLPIERQVASLVTANKFWQEYAQHNNEEPFLSTEFIVANKNFSEMMFALSVLDIPFTAGKHQIEYVQEKMSFSSDKPALIFHQEIKEVEAKKAQSTILISQRFFARDDRYMYKNNERFDKFVAKEFVAGRVYGCQIVLTNPTSARRKLDILLQIPSGAMPVLNGFYTKSFYYELGAYTTHKMEYYFYFPVKGKFAHYPVHVAQNTALIAWEAPFTFNVVDKLSTRDTTSWNYVSQYGSADEVIAYLRNQNLYRVDLKLMAFRMRDKSFFDRAIAVLQHRRVYNGVLWSYGLHHKNEAVIKEFLPNSSYTTMCGKYISSKLLTVEPIVRHTYQHKEYWPLIHPRVYQLGQKRQILNKQFFQQYSDFQTYMRYRPSFDNDDRITMVVYLLLQDRVEEALAVMKKIDRNALATKLQFDYLQAYMHFYLEAPQQALAIANKYKDHPVARWQMLFNDVIAQVKEISGKATQIVNEEDRGQKQTQLAASEPSFDFSIDKQKLSIKYQNLQNCEVHYYPMDIELLFSRKPFVQEVSGQFAIIHPNSIQKISFDKDANHKAIDIPNEYRERNVMVEVVAAGKSKTRSYYPHSLNLQMIENYGQLKLTRLEDNKPLSKVYVKVYARYNNGSVQFYKDGYTDLRGRFDYTSLNTDELERVSRFSILILSEEHGAMIREVAPPKM